MVKYANCHQVEGLQNVLYQCPHCETEWSVQVKDKSTLVCAACGFEQTSDRYGFLHNHKQVGRERRHVSEWSREIYNRLKERVKNGTETGMHLAAKIRMIDENKRKFVEIGQGMVSIEEGHLKIRGTLRGEDATVSVPMTNFASLPFSPGKYFEIQQGEGTYRCYPEDGRLVMKFVNLVKIHYELNAARKPKSRRRARA